MAWGPDIRTNTVDVGVTHVTPALRAGARRAFGSAVHLYKMAPVQNLVRFTQQLMPLIAPEHLGAPWLMSLLTDRPFREVAEGALRRAKRGVGARRSLSSRSVFSLALLRLLDENRLQTAALSALSKREGLSRNRAIVSISSASC